MLKRHSHLYKTFLSLRFVLTLGFSLLACSCYAAFCQNCLSSAGMGCSCDFHAFSDDPAELGDFDGFQTFNNGWTNTASGPSGLGQPVDLTWSIVPDRTSLPRGLGEPSAPSSLISFLDSIHHGGASPGGADITQRDWFPLFESSFERWDELSGINFAHVTDDGAPLPGASGVLGFRGDHRIGGHPIDGQTSPTFLAYNFFPNIADMVIDTDEINRWGNPDGNFIRFRNMLMHEVGHGLGLNHVVSSDADILMGPFLAVAFDGPQLDDILAVHRLYGDVNEEGAGNENYLDSTSLGRFWPGQSFTLGADAANTSIDFDDTDFVSIDDDSDTDFYRFTVLAPSIVDLELTPLGPTYSEGPQGGSQSPFNTALQSDLSLTLWDADGTTILDSANSNGLGGNETIDELLLFEPGDYYVSVEGAQNAAQFYELDLSLSAPFPGTPNFFEIIVRDFARRAGFGRFFGGNSGYGVYILPEPSTGVMLACSGICVLSRRRREST